MGLVLESVMCSREEDEDRFRAIIDAAIKAKKLKTFKVLFISPYFGITRWTIIQIGR
jgi:hypothetical protein